MNSRIRDFDTDFAHMDRSTMWGILFHVVVPKRNHRNMCTYNLDSAEALPRCKNGCGGM